MQGLRGVEGPRSRRAGPLEMTLEEEFAAISDAALEAVERRQPPPPMPANFKCPVCGQPSLWDSFNMAGTRWGYCSTHRLRWPLGPECYKNRDDEHIRAINAALFGRYMPVSEFASTRRQ